MEAHNNHDTKSQRDTEILSIITQATACGFFVSSLYDIGYYKELGFFLSELPTTFSDHVRTCINWLPYISLVAFGLILHGIVIKRLKDGMTEEEIIARSSIPRFIRHFKSLPYKAFVIFCITITFSSLFYYDDVRPYLPAAYAIIWIELLAWCIMHPRIIPTASLQTKLAIIFFPALCLYVWQMGKNEAYTQLKDYSNTSHFVLNDNSTISGKLMRSIEKGYIVRDDRNNAAIILITSSSVLAVHPRSKKTYEPTTQNH